MAVEAYKNIKWRVLTTQVPVYDATNKNFDIYLSPGATFMCLSGYDDETNKWSPYFQGPMNNHNVANISDIENNETTSTLSSNMLREDDFDPTNIVTDEGTPEAPELTNEEYKGTWYVLPETTTLTTDAGTVELIKDTEVSCPNGVWKSENSEIYIKVTSVESTGWVKLTDLTRTEPSTPGGGETPFFKKVFLRLPFANASDKANFGLYQTDNGVMAKINTMTEDHIIGIQYDANKIPEGTDFATSTGEDIVISLNTTSAVTDAVELAYKGTESNIEKWWPIDIAYGSYKPLTDAGTPTYVRVSEMVENGDKLTFIPYNAEYLGYSYITEDETSVYTYFNGTMQMMTQLSLGDPVDCEDGIYVDNSSNAEDPYILVRMVKQVTTDSSEYLGYVLKSKLTKENPLSYKGTWYVAADAAIIKPIDETGTDSTLAKDTKVVCPDGVWKEDSNTIWLNVTVEESVARTTQTGWVRLIDLTRTVPSKPENPDGPDKPPVNPPEGGDDKMAEGRIEWDQVGKKRYETGCDRGVLYLQKNGKYENGVAWNGLTSATFTPSGGEDSAQYADNIKYLNLKSAEELGISINCFTTPDEWDKCDGSADIAKGVSIGQQARSTFGFCCRTKIGNDTEGDTHGYKLHLVYGCSASPSEKAYNTTNESPEVIEFSYEISTTPVPVEGKDADGKPFKPTALVEIDSTQVNPVKLAEFEDILYGKNAVPAGEGTDAQPAVAPRLPLPTEIMAFFAEG